MSLRGSYQRAFYNRSEVTECWGGESREQSDYEYRGRHHCGIAAIGHGSLMDELQSGKV